MLRDLKRRRSMRGRIGQEARMTKAKMLGGALVGIAMALTGCAGAGTAAEAAPLQDITTVEASIDGRTDLFYDAVQSSHLLTADEVNGSPTAQPVEVQLTDDMLIAWRAQPSTPAAERARTAADVVAQFRIVGTVDLTTATAIGNETHPGDPGAVVLPGGTIPGLTAGGGAQRTGSVTHFPLGHFPAPTGFRIDWGTVNGIPNAVDVNTYQNIVNAHPGCA